MERLALAATLLPQLAARVTARLATMTILAAQAWVVLALQVWGPLDTTIPLAPQVLGPTPQA